MEERKQIDRLFQEKFKDFEATPREEAWQHISSKLQEKKRRKSAIPMWYKIAGVAALIALLLNIANNLFKPATTAKPAQTAFNSNEETLGEFTLASPAYTQKMIRSSMVLQTLMQDTQNKRKQELLSAERNNRLIAENSIPNMEISDVINLSERIAANKKRDELPSEKKTKNTQNRRDLPVTNPDKKSPEVSDISSEKRIKISTVAAPIYYDNFGNGSSIDAQFAHSSSDGEVSMAYGINFAYKISEKVRIRSGVTKVGMSYNTNNIAFTAAVNPAALSGIDYGGNAPNYKIENRSVSRFSNLQASTEFNRSSLAAPASGFLKQKLGFIEVPLEVEYVLIDKKFGINIIGGGSTLFLDENTISLNSDNFSTTLGQANNLNNVSFTTNLGVGIDYNISPQFQFNLEPILKYQLNTFSGNTTGTLNPYYFGVYSGFSFKF